MTFKRGLLLAATMLISTGVFAANLPSKTQTLTANLQTQATLTAQWVPSTIYGLGSAPLNQNIGVLTLNSSHVTKISIISTTEVNSRSGIITFYNANKSQWLIANIRPISGVTIAPIGSGFDLTPSNGQANLPNSLPLQFYAQYVSNGGGVNGNNITSGQFSSTVNITTEIG